MLLKRFYDPKLAQASYLVGCTATGEAVVVDPNRDADQYLEAANAEGLRISQITETHIHADFVSGSRELAARTGGQLLLSDEGDAGWKYPFAEGDGAVLLKDRATFMVGNIRFQALHTPGHTPEHLSFLVTDTAATEEPMGVFTGDFIFVGDVGRPDLLEKAAKVAGTMTSAARTLYRSLQRFRDQPGHLQIWPGHGAGSACGKALGAVPQSTLGYERIVNWGLQPMTEDEFVERVLAGQPDPPRYFAQMKRINKEGPQILGGARRPPRLAPEKLRALLGRTQDQPVVVDIRPDEAFARGHVPGTVNIPLDRSFTTWAGWLVPYERDFYLLTEDDSRLDSAVRDLTMIGLERVAGYFGAEALAGWEAGGSPLQFTPQMTAGELAAARRGEGVNVVDVRSTGEWESGHLAGVPNIPLGELVDRLAELPRDRPLVVHCQSGARSAIGTSLLQARGMNVVNLIGGFAAWQDAGYPVEPGAGQPALGELATARDV